MKVLLGRAGSRLVSSPALRSAVRTSHAALRRASSRSPTVHVFHDAQDPYSHLLAVVMPAFSNRYRVQIVEHVVPPPDADAAPESRALADWARRDAARLALHHGLALPTALPANLAVTPQTLQAGDALRRRLGHYLGATLYFEGEWYWGIDRLHYLEARLTQAGLRKEIGHEPLYPPPRVSSAHSAAPTTVDLARARRLTFFCSLRSPYTYLAVGRVRALAASYGATLELAFVLPMVMRGLPVNQAKRLYIVRDAKQRGYTEPDPRDDLSGTDVARKLIILGREMGLDLEMSDVQVESLVPAGLERGSIDEFLQRLPQHDAAMKGRFERATAAGKVLRYVGRLTADGKATVGVVELERKHPFANIALTDNVVRFATSRYNNNPLIVQGPGAGPEVTAGGIFADLLRLSAYLGARL